MIQEIAKAQHILAPLERTIFVRADKFKELRLLPDKSFELTYTDDDEEKTLILSNDTAKKLCKKIKPHYDVYAYLKALMDSAQLGDEVDARVSLRAIGEDYCVGALSKRIKKQCITPDDITRATASSNKCLFEFTSINSIAYTVKTLDKEAFLSLDFTESLIKEAFANSNTTAVTSGSDFISFLTFPRNNYKMLLNKHILTISTDITTSLLDIEYHYAIKVYLDFRKPTTPLKYDIVLAKDELVMLSYREQVNTPRSTETDDTMDIVDLFYSDIGIFKDIIESKIRNKFSDITGFAKNCKNYKSIKDICSKDSEINNLESFASLGVFDGKKYDSLEVGAAKFIYGFINS